MTEQLHPQGEPRALAYAASECIAQACPTSEARGMSVEGGMVQDEDYWRTGVMENWRNGVIGVCVLRRRLASQPVRFVV